MPATNKEQVTFHISGYFTTATLRRTKKAIKIISFSTDLESICVQAGGARRQDDSGLGMFYVHLMMYIS
jgi:hypothetical protein